LICAALLKNLKNASLLLINYDELKNTLQEIKKSTTELFICDLGLREDVYEEIVKLNKFAKVTIIDHHPTSKKTLNKLKKNKIKIIFSETDCASVILYSHFKNDLDRKAARLAAYAAISDQFDKGFYASRILEKFDKHFIYHEALILTHALEHRITDEKKIAIVEELERFVYPHRIDWIVEMALTHLENMRKLRITLPYRAKKDGSIAIVEGDDKSSMGTISSLLLNTMDTNIGLCYKKKKNKIVNISIRGKNKIKLHLGDITKRLAEKYGGFGGGHMKASGASIPEKNLEKFINDFNLEINNPI
jgi:nanoRNase/pAp phosphatase (c-di-AMP/oligoRNAs hydrolase)